MDTFLVRYWYILLGAVLGITVAAIVFGPMVAARASNRIAPRQYVAGSALAAFLVGLIAGAIAVPLLGPDTLSGAVIALVFLGVVLGWVLMFENKAVQIGSWFSFLRPIRPIPERMAVPVKHSWAFSTLFLVVGLIAGACIRILGEAA